ncbi:MAG: cation:proton antiporter [Rubripirellula sp.]
MSEYQVLAVIAAFVFLYSIVASRLEKTRFSGALVYVLCGLILGPFGFHLIDLDVDGEAMKSLAELTLAVVLFSDSAGADLSVLRRVRRLPVRLLLVGLPLTILLGFAAGVLVYPNLSWIEIALLATMLAPTDAALGKAVITNESVPSTVRQGLNVESGLNDGICVPVILLLLALASGAVDEGSIATQMLNLPLQAIGIGALVGVVFAVAACISLDMSMKRGWICGVWIQVPVVALALVCFAVAQWLGGSGFIACFVGGLTFGGTLRERKKELLEAAEGSGNVLSMITWFVFGALFIGQCLRSPDWHAIVYALLSLTVIRMLPVFLSLSGLRMKTDSKLFMGWFGPRGLASIVFIVMVKEASLPGVGTLEQAVTWTILLSVTLHGISANPFAAAYAKRITARQGVV